jgi:preprotein translocase subunit YajC
VARLTDTTVDLEIAPGVVVTFVRQAILEVRRPAGDASGTTGGDAPGATGGRPADGTV